jgi:hypothetical protein
MGRTLRECAEPLRAQAVPEIFSIRAVVEMAGVRVR